MMYPWQKAVWQQCVSAYKAERLPHAILLVAPRGSGVNAFADHLAAHVLGQDAQQQHWLAQQHHPDYYRLTLAKSTDTHKIEQIRQLSQMLQQTSHAAGYQVALIEQAGRMTTQASNALLKTLEEPAGQVLMLLTCEQLDDVLPTIRSRCQVLSLAVHDHEAALTWLQQAQPSASATVCEQYLALAQGAPLLAKDYLNEDALTQQQVLLQIWQQQAYEKESGLVAISKYADTLVKEDLALWWQLVFATLLSLVRHQPNWTLLNYYRQTLAAYRLWRASGVNLKLLLQTWLAEYPRDLC